MDDFIYFNFSGENSHSNYSVDLNKLSPYTFQNFLFQFLILNYKSSTDKFSVKEIVEFVAEFVGS